MIRDFVSRVPGHRLYDINLRRNTTDGVAGYSAEIIDRSCAVATIVKANEGELTELSQEFGFSSAGASGVSDQTGLLWSQMEQLRKRYGLWAVVVTRGGKGALLLTEDSRVQLPDSTLPPDRIHPVGAGDAFSAGLLYSLTQNLPLEQSARIADKLASWVTGYTAATPTLTEEIKQQLSALQ
jgi:sugar/nucleoside kinase (ribokinase family)